MLDDRLVSAFQYLAITVVLLLIALLLVSCGGPESDPDAAHIVGSDIHIHQSEGLYEAIEFPIDYGIFRVTDFEACVVIYFGNSTDVAVAIPENSTLYQKCIR